MTHSPDAEAERASILGGPDALAAMLRAYTIEAYGPREPGSDTGQLTVDRSSTNLLGGTIFVGADFMLNVEGGGFASPFPAQRRSGAPGRHRFVASHVVWRSPSCGRRIQAFRRAETGPPTSG
jgi:hypothetical protein